MKQQIAILAIISIFASVGLSCQNGFNDPMKQDIMSCSFSGGKIDFKMACNAIGNFQNACSATAASCSARQSHYVMTCNCGTSKCWDGNKCKALVVKTQCEIAGGKVINASACTSASDFAATCAIGPYGCAPEYSHTIKSCDCGAGKCWDGTNCVGIPV